MTDAFGKILLFGKAISYQDRRIFGLDLTTALHNLDPPGHGGIGGHYFHVGCPCVRHKIENALRTKRLTDTMHENNNRLLAGAWWVIFNSPALHNIYFLFL